LGGTFEDMQSQFDEGFKLLTTSLGEGVVSGEDAQPFGTQYENESMQEQPSGGTISGGSPDFWTLAAVSALEDGDPQGRADVAQSIYNRASSGVFGTTSIRGIILSGNGKQYEPVGRAVRQFNSIQDREGAIKSVMAANKLSRSQAEKMIDDTVSAITNPTLKKKAAEFVENRTDFLGAGLTPERPSSTKLRRRNASDNIFGNYVGPGSYEYGRKSQGQASTVNLQFPTTSAPAQTSPVPSTPGRGVTTTVRDELDVARNKSSLGGLTPGQGFGAYRSSRRSHAGIDIGTYGEKGFYVSFKQSGTVTYAQNNGDGYGNLVIIKVGNIEFYFAHLAKIMVKNGQPYNGETIGEIGKTGGNYDIHLHFEARPGGKAIDPKPYLGLLSIGRQLTGAPGQPVQIAAPTPAQITSSGTQQRQQASQQLAQQQVGPSIVILEEEPPPQSQGSFGGGGAMMIPIIINPLNSFITKKLLLDLAYT
jgi:murein DD-endopeptidase MepM/ murein hydrolase activator NlpD